MIVTYQPRATTSRTCVIHTGAADFELVVVTNQLNVAMD